MFQRSLWPWLSWENGDTACRLNTASELSLYQSECDVWSVAAAALTGLPAYPRLTCPFHPFCLFLHCSSTPSSIIPSVSGCDDPIQVLKLSISPRRIHVHQFPHQGSHNRRFRTPLLFIPVLCSQVSSFFPAHSASTLRSNSVKPWKTLHSCSIMASQWYGVFLAWVNSFRRIHWLVRGRKAPRSSTFSVAFSYSPSLVYASRLCEYWEQVHRAAQ